MQVPTERLLDQVVLCVLDGLDHFNGWDTWSKADQEANKPYLVQTVKDPCSGTSHFIQMWRSLGIHDSVRDAPFVTVTVTCVVLAAHFDDNLREQIVHTLVKWGVPEAKIEKLSFTPPVFNSFAWDMWI